jgi:Fe-S-cluster containining protein
MRLGFHRPSGDDEEMERATVAVDAFGESITEEVEVPAGPTTTRRMLPLFRSLAETLIDRAVARVEAEGKSISCRRGCSACCQQLVPISPAEAHALRAVVDALPEDRRARVLSRFEDATRRIEASALAGRLRARTWNDDDEAYTALALAYFRLGIPCPFLDDEGACSIYLDRPVICREFLVTSPAERCANPAPGEVTAIPLPGQVSRKLSSLDPVGAKGGAPWTPLTLALTWASEHPEDEPRRTGLQILERFFAKPRPSPRRASAKKRH